MSIYFFLGCQVNISFLLLQFTALPTSPIVNAIMEPSYNLGSERDRGWSFWWIFGKKYPHWRIETIRYENRPHLDDATFFRITHSDTKEKKRLTPEEFAAFDGGRLYEMEKSRSQLQAHETKVSHDEQETTNSWFGWLFSCF